VAEHKLSHPQACRPGVAACGGFQHVTRRLQNEGANARAMERGRFQCSSCVTVQRKPWRLVSHRRGQAPANFLIFPSREVPCSLCAIPHPRSMANKSSGRRDSGNSWFLSRLYHIRLISCLHTGAWPRRKEACRSQQRLLHLNHLLRYFMVEQNYIITIEHCSDLTHLTGFRVRGDWLWCAEYCGQFRHEEVRAGSIPLYCGCVNGLVQPS
jgi:hypothetical protein